MARQRLRLSPSVLRVLRRCAERGVPLRVVAGRLVVVTDEDGIRWVRARPAVGGPLAVSTLSDILGRLRTRIEPGPPK